ncbi:MAG: hypothetical protein ACYS6W_07700 [Planctomycetota bacterium]|jgi:hypothetical protein
MKRIVLISILVPLVLSLAGCTIVEKHYIRRGPRPHAPLSMQTHRRQMLPPRRYPLHPGGPPYELRRRKGYYVH